MPAGVGEALNLTMFVSSKVRVGGAMWFFSVLCCVLLLFSIPTSHGVDSHQNGWTNLNWSTSTIGRNGSLSQDFTPLRIDWPKEYQGWTFWYQIQYCWQRNLDYGSGSSCGYLGILLNGDSNNQLSGIFEQSYRDAKDFRITEFDNQSQCERFDPSQNIKGTGKIVCYTAINVKRGTTYRLRMFANQSLGDNWWSASVQDLNSGKILTLGNIQGLANDSSRPFSSIATHVGYMGPAAKCDSVPIADYLVGNLKINNVLQSYAGYNSASCTTSAVSPSSKVNNGFLMRTGGSSPISRDYSNAAGTSLQAISATAITSAPPAPTNYTSRIVGSSAIITIQVSAKESSRATSAHLYSSALGIKKNPGLQGDVVGTKALIEVPIKASMAGKKYPITIYLKNSKGESTPLNATLTIPKAPKAPTLPTALPKPVVPKAVICSFGTQTRTFEDKCPPGWEKR